jgi:exosortase
MASATIAPAAAAAPTGSIDAPAATPTASRPVTRNDLLVAAGLALACVLIMLDAWKEILRIGLSNEEVGYVLVAPVMILWIAVKRRGAWRHCRIGGAWLGLVGLLAGWATYWYGYFADPVLWRAGAVVALGGAVVAGLGRDVLRRFLPCFVAAVFLIPVSPNGRYRLAVPLQQATAHATQTVCDVVGIEVDRSGSKLTVNGKDVAVAEACNGMRMILTLFMICYVVAFSLRLPMYFRIFILVASPVVAIIANVLRLVPTVWLFGHASPATATGFHDVSGWVMTVLAFLVLMGVFRVFEEATDEAAAAGDNKIIVRTTAAATPAGGNRR